MNLAERQRRIQRSHELLHQTNCRGIDIYRADVESPAQEVWKIASGAAARVEHTATPVETASQELIEQIDIDAAERGFQFV